jgi:hypothetical protein
MEYMESEPTSTPHGRSNLFQGATGRSGWYLLESILDWARYTIEHGSEESGGPAVGSSTVGKRVQKAEDKFHITQDEEERMDLGRVMTRSLGFFEEVPSNPDHQMAVDALRDRRERGCPLIERNETCQISCKNGEKEQNEKRNRSLGNNVCKRHSYEIHHIQQYRYLKFPKRKEQRKQENEEDCLTAQPADLLEKAEGRGQPSWPPGVQAPDDRHMDTKHSGGGANECRGDKGPLTEKTEQPCGQTTRTTVDMRDCFRGCYFKKYSGGSLHCIDIKE